jgi:predicted Zn-dependent peptidase
MGMVESIKMDNGLQIISCLMPHMQSVSIVVGIKSGSIYETKHQQGISHFIEHMLFKGTEKRKNTLEISQAIEQLGGEINASTSEECTFIYSKVLHRNFADAFEVLVDILNNSLFRAEDIRQEKKVVIEEINKYQDIPEDWIVFLINSLMWKDTALGQNVLGEKGTIKRFNRKLLLLYFQEMYQPRNMVISITGNISPKAITIMLEKFPFLARKGMPRIVSTIGGAVSQIPELKLINKRVKQAHLCFGFEGISRFHRDKIAMDLLNIILGAGLSSRLFQEVRVKEGLAYDIHSYPQYFDQTGSFNIYAGVIADGLTHSIQKILDELKKIKEKHISHTELKIAQEMYKGSILMGLENTLSFAFRLGSYALLYDKEYNYQEIIDRIESVQAEDIRKLAENIFQNHKIKLVIFSPSEMKIRKDSLLAILKV